MGWPTEEAEEKIIDSIQQLSPKIRSIQNVSVYERDAEECSYHTFFLVISGEQFRYKTETDPNDFEEEVGDSVPGSGEIGLIVGLSMLAPIAMVATSYQESFENGDYTEPDFRSPESEYPIHPDIAAELAVLSAKVVSLMQEQGLRVLSVDEARQKTPWLKPCEEVALDPQGEMTVFDAFFFGRM